MKQKLLLLLTLLSVSYTSAQDVDYYTPRQGEGIAYFLPKTQVRVTITAQKTIFTPGEFCQYANRYLRLNDVSSQAETKWDIKGIHVETYGVPDSTKAYIIKLKDKSVASNIALNDRGIVIAINTDAPRQQKASHKPAPPTVSNDNPREFMTEEILSAGSSAKMAELTAKEILNIRESKNSIVRGNADNLPKDGESLKLMLANLDRQEKALTAAFTGSTSTEEKQFTFDVTPSADIKGQVVARFSRLLGVLPTDNYAGEPIYIDIQPVAPLPIVRPDEKKKKRPEGIIYNIPAEGLVKVYDNQTTFVNGKLLFTQFGTTETLTKKLFDRKVNTRVVFNEDSGAILRIDKD